MTKLTFSKWQLVTMGSAIGIGLFNPASVEILEPYFKLFYTGVFLVCVAWFIAFSLYKVLKPEHISLPKKSKKSKVPASAYITT